MYVKVHVYPGMKKEQIKEISLDRYELIIKAPAERNAANIRVKEIVAELYKVSPAAVRIVTGHHSPSKILEVITKES